MVTNTNIKALIGKMSEEEHSAFFDDILERQETEKFYKTAEALANLEPVDSDGFNGKVACLVGESWEKALQYHPAYKVENIKIELKNLLIMLSDCTRVASEAYGELQDIASKDYDKKLYHDNLNLRISKEFYTFVHLAQSLVDVGRRYRTKKSEILPTGETTDVYDELVKTYYSDEHNHLFISEMRNNLSHVILHRPDWQISKDFKSNKQEAGYFFDARYLFYRGSWKSKKFKSYLKSLEKIDCYEEMLKYFKATNKFLDNLLKYDQENLSAAE